MFALSIASTIVSLSYLARIVIHKSSSFSNHELSGFQAAAEGLGIELLELLTISDRETRLFRQGAYPALRGTLLPLTDTEHVFYTRGSVDFYQTLGIKIAKGEHAIFLQRRFSPFKNELE